MLNVTHLNLFCIAAIVLIITPGPDMLYVIARSIGQGKIAGIVSALGICVGILVHTLAAAIGLSALLMTSALAYNIVKYAGAAYLIYLGIRTILSREEQNTFATRQRISLTTTFSQGVLSNVLNPKIALFFIAFLPQFVDTTQGGIALQIAILGLIFDAMTIFCFVSVAYLICTPKLNEY
ncbi:LysE family translocator [Iningainema tapete]|uniref:LysE family translocator n=1 Tax=Iningainema tapete BLCC-T55 TaxID=2748662 RepID=A0A8J6XJC2_9CYAN|nr:LysE family translocator [Iningainema tapete]MBD2773907.1 LysE family translocator [Iningainema tapete BLCC-T55]